MDAMALVSYDSENFDFLAFLDPFWIIIAGHLYNIGVDNILRRCVLEHERPRILVEAHEGIDGGHYAGKSTAQKVLHT
jgi:hypothetical protein